MERVGSWCAIAYRPWTSAVYGGGFGNGVNLGVNGSGAFVHQARVSAGFFRVLGIAPLIGREFSSDEDRQGGPPVVILSHAVWTKYFGQDRDIIGRGIHLAGRAVYSRSASCPRVSDSTKMPICGRRCKPSKTGEGGGSNYGMIARLRPGANWEQARSQMALLTDDVRRLGVVRQEFRSAARASRTFSRR